MLTNIDFFSTKSTVTEYAKNNFNAIFLISISFVMEGFYQIHWILTYVVNAAYNRMELFKTDISGPKQCQKIDSSALWQYGLWSFQTGGTKLEIFLPKNQQPVLP